MADKLTAASIYTLARKAGFSTGEAVTATAIALSESGGDPTVIGDQSLQTSKWGPSVGLWQIRTLKAERGKGTTRDYDWLLASASNQAKAAYEIRKGKNGWGNWTMFTNGQYKGKVASVEQAVGTQERIGGEQWWQKFTVIDNIASAVTGTDNDDFAANASAGVDQATSALSEAGNLLHVLNQKNFWIRTGLGLLGAVVIILAIIVMLWSQKQKIIGGAVNAVAGVGQVKNAPNVIKSAAKNSWKGPKA